MQTKLISQFIPNMVTSWKFKSHFHNDLHKCWLKFVRAFHSRFRMHALGLGGTVLQYCSEPLERTVFYVDNVVVCMAVSKEAHTQITN